MTPMLIRSLLLELVGFTTLETPMVVQVVHRDFNADHPDFFRDGRCSTVVTTGMVAATLGADGKPVCVSRFGNCGSSCQALSMGQPDVMEDVSKTFSSKQASKKAHWYYPALGE